MKENKIYKAFRVVSAETSDEELWKEFWSDKSPEEKLNITEEMMRGKNAPPRLQRVYRVVERLSS
jgi:hypothetical protein